jgi:ankyrin repeat protein
MRALLSGNCNGYLTNIDVETCENKGRTAFHLACIYGHYEIAKMLLEEWGANPMVRAT